MGHNVEKKVKVGVAWSASATIVSQVITFALGIILARLLQPEDFGIFAAIFIFNEVSSSIVSSGIVTALVQRKDTREEHFSTAFVIQIIMALIVFAVLISVSPWVGMFLHNSLIGDVLAVTSISVLILPFSSIPTATLYKQINFRTIGIVDTSQQLVMGVVSIFLAYFGWGVWSLVYGRLIGNTFKAIMLSYSTRWIPSFRFNRQAKKDIFSFSVKVILSNILNDIANNIDYFIIGRILGPTALGFYSRAYNLMTLPLTRITRVMNSVLFPAFSDMQDDNQALRRGLLKAVSYISVISFPVLTGLFWVSPSFIYTLYGEKWMGSVLPLKIMCFAGMVLSVEPILISVIIAKGYIGFEIRRQIIYLLFLITGVYIGSYWGLVGVSFAVLFAASIFFILCFQLLKGRIQMSWYRFIGIFMPAIVGCGTMSLIIFLYQSIIIDFFALYSLPMLLSTVAIGIIFYFVCLLFFKHYFKSNQIVTEVFCELESYISKALGYVIRKKGSASTASQNEQ